jgi:hypothetical protein
VWKVLDSPWVSRAGNVVFLAGVLQVGIRLLMGLSLANAVTVVLIPVGIALMVIAHWPKRRSEQPTSRAEPDPVIATESGSPGRIHGSAAIGQTISELTEDENQALIIAEFVTMIEEGKKLLESEFTGELTWSQFDPWWKGIMAFVGSVFGDAERQRLIEIKPTGAEPKDRVNAVMDWLRERRDHPERWTPKLSGDDLAAALRKRRDATADPLGDQIDSLMREGIALVTTLSTPVEPEETENGVWKISGGDAPQEWVDLAAAFQQRCRTLLETQRPALLADFREGHMKHFRMEREANERREQNPAADRRSDSEKMLALADYERSGPRREVEACLEGLAAARKAI